MRLGKVASGIASDLPTSPSKRWNFAVAAPGPRFWPEQIIAIMFETGFTLKSVRYWHGRRRQTIGDRRPSNTARCMKSLAPRGGRSAEAFFRIDAHKGLWRQTCRRLYDRSYGTCAKPQGKLRGVGRSLARCHRRHPQFRERGTLSQLPCVKGPSGDFVHASRRSPRQAVRPKSAMNGSSMTFGTGKNRRRNIETERLSTADIHQLLIAAASHRVRT